jgi:hypothetical protein
MKPLSRIPAYALAGLFAIALAVRPQDYTVSAKPGVVNYVEGIAYLNGNRISEIAMKTTFLNTNDSFSTGSGKAEVLLTPGVFLRMGDNSEIRMISPSLIHTRVELVRGEAMVEVARLEKGNDIQIVDHGGSVALEKNGLYRFTAENPPTAAVIDGKAEVSFADEKIDLKKGHLTELAGSLKSEKLDLDEEDELYAWSNLRSQYDAAASYQAASAAGMNASGYTYGGWYFDNPFDCWAWLPASGAFYSPFGWGFYSPGAIGRAPVVTTGIVKGGHWVNDPDKNGGHKGDHPHRHWEGPGKVAPVPVNPRKPPAVGILAASPSQERVLRTAAGQSFAESGFRTQTGARPLGFSGNRSTRANSGRESGWSGSSGRAAGRSGGSARTGGSAGTSRAGGFGGGSHSGGGGGHASGSSGHTSGGGPRR